MQPEISSSKHRREIRLSILPTIYSTMTKDERFRPSKQQQQTPTNKVKSTRFSPLTFVPIALFLQYKKVVVCFFTVNTII